MTPRLPLEVVERIIDDVVEYNNFDHISSHKCLKACALVCHSFLPLCRKHIFAYVTLHAPSFPTSDDLNQLLSNSPHLAVYIRKLDYNVSKKEFAKRRFLWLIPMFEKLVRLQFLTISYLGSSRCKRLDWMSSSERKVLLPLIHLPTLTRITLRRIRNFTLADLASCVNLKKLEICSLESSNGVGNFLEALPPTPAMLEHLVIDMDDEIKPQAVQQLCRNLCDARRPDGKPIIDVSSLRIISSDVARFHLVTELYGMCRNLHKINLTSMSLPQLISSYIKVNLLVRYDPSDSEPITSSLMGLFNMIKPSLPTLVEIDLTFDIIETYDGPLNGLCHELEKMVGQNVVETIKLKIWVEQDCYDCTRWGELDDVLMGSPEGWPALRNVSLLFFIVMTSRDGSDKALQELVMTKLVESKQVQFDSKITVFHLNL